MIASLASGERPEAGAGAGCVPTPSRARLHHAALICLAVYLYQLRTLHICSSTPRKRYQLPPYQSHGLAAGLATSEETLAQMWNREPGSTLTPDPLPARRGGDTAGHARRILGFVS